MNTRVRQPYSKRRQYSSTLTRGFSLAQPLGNLSSSNLNPNNHYCFTLCLCKGAKNDLVCIIVTFVVLLRILTVFYLQFCYHHVHTLLSHNMTPCFYLSFIHLLYAKFLGDLGHNTLDALFSNGFALLIFL